MYTIENCGHINFECYTTDNSEIVTYNFVTPMIQLGLYGNVELQHFKHTKSHKK